jgi:hypothetical protein
MLRAVSRAALAVARENTVAARRYGTEPFDAARAAHELEVARLALEEKKVAQTLALEEKKVAQTLALEQKKLEQQGRGAWRFFLASSARRRRS